MKFRKYQKKDYKILKREAKDYRHILFGAATGYGKSSVIYNLAEKYISKGKRVLVIAPRRKLVRQLETTLLDFIPSIIMGSDSTYYEGSELYIASTATLHNRLKKYGKSYLGKIDLILIDEVHINFGTASMQELVNLYWDKAQWIGLSATPIDNAGYRLEGYDHTIYEHQTQDLIDIGWLTPVKVMVEDVPKGLDEISMSGGDYAENELAEFMMDGARVSNLYSIWKKYAKKRKTMIFAVTINHANMIYKDFIDKGVAAAVVHSDLDEISEGVSLQEFKDGAVDVIINVGKLTTGFDETSVNCLLLARPTKSLRLYLQIIGRGLRIHEGKKDCLILDLAGNIDQNGYPTMRRDFNKVKPPPREEKKESFTEIECDSCGYSTQLKNCKRKIKETKAFTRTRWYCPNCEEILKENVIDNKKVKRMKEIQDYSDISKVTGADVQTMIHAVQDHNNYKPGWVAYISKDWKRSDKIRDGLKLIYKKWDLEMINMDTVLRNINKLRADNEA